MASSGFYYRSGPWNFGKVDTTTTTALAVGDALRTTSGLLALGATSVKVTGVSLGTKAVGDVATTPISFLSTLKNSRFLAYVKGGTLATTERHDLLDLTGNSGAQGINADTSTHDDMFIDTVLIAGTSTSTPQGAALIIFADPSYLHATN